MIRYPADSWLVLLYMVGVTVGCAPFVFAEFADDIPECDFSGADESLF